jgi:hypothetical protein
MGALCQPLQAQKWLSAATTTTRRLWSGRWECAVPPPRIALDACTLVLLLRYCWTAAWRFVALAALRCRDCRHCTNILLRRRYSRDESHARVDPLDEDSENDEKEPDHPHYYYRCKWWRMKLGFAAQSCHGCVLVWLCYSKTRGLHSLWFSIVIQMIIEMGQLELTLTRPSRATTTWAYCTQ